MVRVKSPGMRQQRPDEPPPPEPCPELLMWLRERVLGQAARDYRFQLQQGLLATLR
ncbi:hypothetical protein [Mumia zhuanghuii]|uniref:hypothetical protein n=1 Tax=Mumia zhuanghuii TaxID=2585211 RepID=UPI00129D20B3|nr:hypothetical protein [Mumia zhuanghuii]